MHIFSKKENYFLRLFFIHVKSNLHLIRLVSRRDTRWFDCEWENRETWASDALHLTACGHYANWYFPRKRFATLNSLFIFSRHSLDGRHVARERLDHPCLVKSRTKGAECYCSFPKIYISGKILTRREISYLYARVCSGLEASARVWWWTRSPFLTNFLKGDEEDVGYICRIFSKTLLEKSTSILAFSSLAGEQRWIKREKV